MFQQAFEAGQFGYGSAVAVTMLVLLIPILIFNVRRSAPRRYMSVLAGGVVHARPTPAGRIVAALEPHGLLHVGLALIGLIWLVPTLGCLSPRQAALGHPVSQGGGTSFNLHLTAENLTDRLLEAQGMPRRYANTASFAVPSTAAPARHLRASRYAFSWMRLPVPRHLSSSCVVGLLMCRCRCLHPGAHWNAGSGPGPELTKGYGAVWLAHTAFAHALPDLPLAQLLITLGHPT